MIALEATGLRKTFRERSESLEVLRGASLVLRNGEVAALEGPSGSGKSTLLCILGCILTADEGSLSIGGAPVDRRTDLARLRRDKIGFVFQQFNLLPALDAVENVAYPLRLAGVSRRDAIARANEALGIVGLGARARSLPRDLSGGQKQRVAIARALVTRPAVLLADEPTANLDADVGKIVLELFARLAREMGSALLIVTHDPKVRAICDRVLRIDAGTIAEG